IGMQIVRDEAGLEKALKAAADRGAQAFGDARVYVERYIERPRHIEVQVFGDEQGHVVALGERECSVQRRHQKIIEESPAPAFENRADGEALRSRILEAAVRVAKSAGYVGAGTVEFIWEDAQSSYYFLEVNCRLQVEHPVTEMVTGLDLVELQLRVASGEPLPDAVQSGSRSPYGHAIEVRVYAEDPYKGFIPKPGAVDAVTWPTGEGVRVDAGVAAGGKVTPHYDPLIAKIVTHGRDRHEAIDRMKKALAETQLSPVVTNLPFLRALVASDEFERGEYDTTFAEAFAKRK
ncbi:MAG: biotin carboxylase, partial [Deltaproteobacteria bacterium]